MARRKYSEEYKQEAVALTKVPGATITAVAADLGINSHMLGKWRKAMEQHGEKAFPGQGHARDEELMRLKRENARLRKERDFLKEAAVDSMGQCNTRYSDAYDRRSWNGETWKARPD